MALWADGRRLVERLDAAGPISATEEWRVYRLRGGHLPECDFWLPVVALAYFRKSSQAASGKSKKGRIAPALFCLLFT